MTRINPIIALNAEQYKIYCRAHVVAAMTINHAMKAGLLPRLFDCQEMLVYSARRRILRGIKCVDCENHAEVYDHRDYFEPLAVDPVCVRCNTRRGPAYKTALLIIERYPAKPSTDIVIVRRTIGLGMEIVCPEAFFKD